MLSALVFLVLCTAVVVLDISLIWFLIFVCKKCVAWVEWGLGSIFYYFLSWFSGNS